MILGFGAGLDGGVVAIEGIVVIPHPPRLEGRLEREGINRPPPEGGGRRRASERPVPNR